MDGRGSAEAHTGLFSAAYRKKKSGKEKETNLVESEGGEIEEKDEEKDENGEKDNDEEVEVVEKEVRNTQRGFKAKKAVNEKAKKENDGEKNTIFGFTYVVHSSRGFWRSDGSVISSLPEK